MYDDIIKHALGGRDNETIIEDEGITNKTTLVVIGEWPDKTFMAGCCENTLYEIYELFDQVADPISVVRIWAAPKTEDIDYIATGEPPVLEKWKRPQQETVAKEK